MPTAPKGMLESALAFPFAFEDLRAFNGLVFCHRRVETRLKSRLGQVSLDLARYLTESPCLQTREGSETTDRIDVSKTGDST